MVLLFFYGVVDDCDVIVEGFDEFIVGYVVEGYYVEVCLVVCYYDFYWYY